MAAAVTVTKGRGLWMGKEVLIIGLRKELRKQIAVCREKMQEGVHGKGRGERIQALLSVFRDCLLP